MASERGGILVAVSGGCDSTALLHLLARTRDRHRHPLRVGHLNHGVRQDADAEETRVRGVAEALGLPFRSEKLRMPGGRIDEASMRRARRRALRGMAESEEPRCWIALAHQRDDQAETVLLHLTRGTGLAGLAGMAPRRGAILRPLLREPRAILRAYLEEIGVAWVEDPTNEDLGRARNLIRRKILPALEHEVRPGSVAAIARASDHLRQILDFVEQEARAAADACRMAAPAGEARLDARMLRSTHPGLLVPILRRTALGIRPGLSDIPSSVWRDVASLCERGVSGGVEIGRAVRIETTDRVVRFSPARGRRIQMHIDETDIPWDGRVDLRPLGVVRARMIESDRLPSEIHVEGLARLQIFDRDSLAPPIRVRLVRKGDRLAPGDRTRGPKVHDLLAEIGIPRSLRGDQPVVEDREGILWVPGVRRSDRARVGSETKRIWMLRWHGRLPVRAAQRGGEMRG